MSSVIVATAIVLGFCLFMYALVQAFEADRLISKWSITAATLTILCVAGLVNASAKEEAQGPCTAYETRYVMVGKVMTPYRVCIERGEWVK